MIRVPDFMAGESKTCTLSLGCHMLLYHISINIPVNALITALDSLVNKLYETLLGKTN